jgi:hypothetical protein
MVDTSSSAKSKIDDFYLDAKEFQALRLMNVVFEDGESRRDTDNVEEIRKGLKQHLEQKKELKHFLDVVVSIDIWYEYYNPSPNRDWRRNRPKWRERRPSRLAIMHPMYVTLTSCLNEQMDSTLRDLLVPATSNHRARIEPISYYVYGNIMCRTKVTNKQLGSGTLALILFQARDLELLVQLTDSSTFFKDSFLEGEELNAVSGWMPIAQSLLRGDYDGFLLLHSTNSLSTSIKSLKAGLTNKRQGFFSKIAPITVLLGHLDTQLDVAQRIDLISQIRQRFVSNRV